MKIFITGCARSGTTLLSRLMNAFNISVYETDISTEISLNDFIKLDNKNIVGKRSYPSVFSSELSGKEIIEQINLIVNHDIKILNVVRDGRDVLLSEEKGKFYVSPSRWIDSIIQSEVFSDIISLQIRYEDLINNPLSIQGQIQQVFGLKQKHYFTKYPDFIKKDTANNDGIYKLRLLSNNSIGKDFSSYENFPLKREFENKLRKLNYIK